MSEESSTSRDQKLPDLEEELSNVFENLMFIQGGSPLLGRILALCTLSAPDKPLLQKDLVSKFKVNPSTVSRNLKELVELKFIDRRRIPGSREWKYQVEHSSFLEMLVNGFEKNSNDLEEVLEFLTSAYADYGNALNQFPRPSERETRGLNIMDYLIEWLTIVKEELDSFIQTLHTRFPNMEKKNQVFASLFLK
ncbi:MAG: MarR family transcriptional regulator [Candidatus Hodarchaeales archaeon]|jgi:DNA-binding transcriptional regulator GbsR (MarR family)